MSNHSCLAVDPSSLASSHSPTPLFLCPLPPPLPVRKWIDLIKHKNQIPLIALNPPKTSHQNRNEILSLFMAYRTPRDLLLLISCASSPTHLLHVHSTGSRHNTVPWTSWAFSCIREPCTLCPFYLVVGPGSLLAPSYHSGLGSHVAFSEWSSLNSLLKPQLGHSILLAHGISLLHTLLSLTVLCVFGLLEYWFLHPLKEHMVHKGKTLLSVE